MLGRPGRAESQAVLTAALAGDTTTALTAFAKAYARGAEPEMLVADFLDLIHLASMHAAGAPSADLIDSDKQTVRDFADFGIARLGRAWQLLLKGHGERTQAPDAAASCEMLIIRLAHAALMPTPGDILQKLPTASPPSTAPNTSPSAPPTPEPPLAQASQPLPITNLTLEASSNVNPFVLKIFGVILSSGIRHSVQVLLANL